MLADSRRIIGLDLLRAIAILAVVLSHTSGFLAPLNKVPVLGAAVTHFITWMSPLGQLGVELFFVLSGFLIGGILIRTYEQSHTFTIKEIFLFLRRRWFRTLPNYWLILTADIILYKLMGFGSFEAYKFSYYFFLQNLWFPHPPYFFGEAWSLSVEEWFYLTLPFCIYIAHHVLKPLNKKRFLLRVFLVYLSVFVLFRLLNAAHPINGEDQDAGIRKVVFFRLDALMYGVFWAYVNYFRRPWLDKWRGALFLSGAAAIAVLYYLIAFRNICNASDPQLRFLSNAFLYLVLPLSFSLLLPYANSINRLPGKVLNKAVLHISKISYSLYLVHYSLIFIPFFSFLKMEDPLCTAILYLLYWCIILLLSSLLYRFFEYPVMQFRDRYGRSR